MQLAKKRLRMRKEEGKRGSRREEKETTPAREKLIIAKTEPQFGNEIGGEDRN